MNYYEHHLGDYMRDTAHLSMLEDAAYRRLLDAYYVREKPLPADLRECYKLARATTKAERDAVAYVLREFFQLGDDGHHQGRADAEIERFRSKSEKARASINARWERTRSELQANNERNTNVSKTAYERNTNDIHRAPVPSPQSPVIQPPPLRGAPPLRGSRLPEDWEPMDEGRQFAMSLGLTDLRCRDEAAKFCDHWRAQPGQKGVKLDWSATWRNWCRRAAGDGIKAPAAQSFRERDSEHKRAEVAQWGGGLVAAKPTVTKVAEIIDMEGRNAALRLG